jgi:phage virion morphogenesis protein
MTVINVDNRELQQKLEHAVAVLADLTPLMQRISVALVDVTEGNFAAQGRPKWAGLRPNYHGFSAVSKDARPQWAGLKPKKAGGTGRMILQQSGQLAASVFPFHGSNYAGVGSNKVYAAIHQFGGTTKAHVIHPVNKKALAFNGIVRKSVNHPGSKIPARPFLPMDKNGNLQREAVVEVEETIDLYLKKNL